MSKASDGFAYSIKDSENLLLHFNALNTKPPPPEIEVLKRAGLIMAMTAWETYVEDRLVEAAEERLHALGNDAVAGLVMNKLMEEIKRLNNPDSSRAIQLFRDYAGVDLSSTWFWNGVDHKTVKNRLNNYLKLRGDIVHRSKPDTATSHPVKKVDLEKAISFLKLLVDATERAFGRV